MLDGPAKSRHLRRTGQGYGCKTLVETGTADHTNVDFLAEFFDRIYTIELDPGFYEMALWAFMDRTHVTPIYGDSGDICEHLAYRLVGPVLWWLDAHFCGGTRGPEDTPILRELTGIFRYRQDEHNVILIDDARLFGADAEYPTLLDIAALVDEDAYDIFVQDDIIHILPRTTT